MPPAAYFAQGAGDEPNSPRGSRERRLRAGFRLVRAPRSRTAVLDLRYVTIVDIESFMLTELDKEEEQAEEVEIEKSVDGRPRRRSSARWTGRSIPALNCNRNFDATI